MARIAEFCEGQPLGQDCGPETLVARLFGYSSTELSRLAGGRRLAPEARLDWLAARISGAKPSKHLQGRACRALLSRLLASEPYTRPGHGAGSWALARARSGAPLLLRSGVPSDLAVSMAHSGSWVAVALAREIRVGVDIEQARSLRDVAAMSEYLGWSPPPPDPARFLRRWTLWEACVKLETSSIFNSTNAAFRALSQNDPGSPICSHERWTLMRAEIPRQMHATLVFEHPGRTPC